MDKLNYTKELITENSEYIKVATYDNTIYITLRDYEDCACVILTLKEAQRVKRYLAEAITTNKMNWEEE